jgi:lipopolysaccharide export system protein LptA
VTRTKLFFLLQVVGLGLLLSLGIVLSHVNADDDKRIHVSSERQMYEPYGGHSLFEGNVTVAMTGTEVTGSHADIMMDAQGKPDNAVFTNHFEMVRANSGSKETIAADTLHLGLKDGNLLAEGAVVTQIKGDAKNGDFSIQSDSQSFDQDKKLMRAEGHVAVKNGDMTAESPEALVFMGPSGAAQKVVFSQGVHLIQGDQEMSAEVITIDIDSGNIYCERNVESTMMGKDAQGKPTKVKISSYLQALDKASGTMIANGNTVVHYDDYLATGPKAVFYKSNNELDHIVLTGRAQIEETDRRVTGDVVTIIVSPRQFVAKGNVTTFIKTKEQQTASSSSSTSSRSKGNAKTPAKTTKPASSSSNTVRKPWEDEVMIENTTKTSGNTKP